MTPPIAFLDVDTQVDFMEPGGRLYARGAEAIKPNLARLVAAARRHGVPLVSSVDAHAPDDPEFAVYPPHCVRGTPGQAKVAETRTEGMVFVPNAPAAPGDLPDPRRVHVVLEKQDFPVWTSAVAEPVLAATGARAVYVFGVVTEVCVKQAALGLLERGYAVRLVTDAIWPLDPAAGEAALAELEARGATRVTTDEALADAAGQRGGPTRRGGRVTAARGAGHEEEKLVRHVEVVGDRTAESSCDEGFLRVRRFLLRNTYSDGTRSPVYPCDVVSRRSVDAVAVVLYHRDAATGEVLVHYREATRPPVWLRRHKQDELPHKDEQPYDLIGEIVAGVLEPGDDGFEGVKRRGTIEAKEEAGYDVDPDHVTDLGERGLFPSPGVTDEKIYLVAAEVDPAARGAAEGDGSVLEEGTRMVTRPLREAIAACRLGEIPDAKTELGLLRLADRLGYIPQLDLFREDLLPDLRARYEALGL